MGVRPSSNIEKWWNLCNMLAKKKPHTHKFDRSSKKWVSASLEEVEGKGGTSKVMHEPFIRPLFFPKQCRKTQYKSFISLTSM